MRRESLPIPIFALASFTTFAVLTVFSSLARAERPVSAPAIVESPQSQQVSAGPITATFSLDRSSMSVAQTVSAVLRVVVPSGVEVELPTSESKLGGFTVTSAVDEPPLAETGAAGLRTVFFRRYALEPFLPGDYTIPALEIRWRRQSSNESGVAHTTPVKINVVSLLPASTSNAAAERDSLNPGTIRDAYSPPVPHDRSTLWLGIVIGAGAASLLAGGVWVGRRKRAALDPVVAEIARINAIRSGTFEASQASQHCHILAGAVRAALADRVDRSAIVSSPAELKSRLDNVQFLSSPISDNVSGLLNHLDEARFSGQTLPKSEFDSLVDQTLSLLTALRALPKPVRSQGGAA